MVRRITENYDGSFTDDGVEIDYLFKNSRKTHKNTNSSGKEKFYAEVVQRRVDSYCKQIHKYIEEEQQRLSHMRGDTPIDLEHLPDIKYEK